MVGAAGPLNLTHTLPERQHTQVAAHAEDPWVGDRHHCHKSQYAQHGKEQELAQTTNAFALSLHGQQLALLLLVQLYDSAGSRKTIPSSNAAWDNVKRHGSIHLGGPVGPVMNRPYRIVLLIAAILIVIVASYAWWTHLRSPQSAAIEDSSTVWISLLKRFNGDVVYVGSDGAYAYFRLGSLLQGAGVRRSSTGDVSSWASERLCCPAPLRERQHPQLGQRMHQVRR
jgi:hypothetical protein